MYEIRSQTVQERDNDLKVPLGNEIQRVKKPFDILFGVMINRGNYTSQNSLKVDQCILLQAD